MFIDAYIFIITQINIFKKQFKSPQKSCTISAWFKTLLTLYSMCVCLCMIMDVYVHPHHLLTTRYISISTTGRYLSVMNEIH